MPFNPAIARLSRRLRFAAAVGLATAALAFVHAQRPAPPAPDDAAIERLGRELRARALEHFDAGPASGIRLEPLTTILDPPAPEPPPGQAAVGIACAMDTLRAIIRLEPLDRPGVVPVTTLACRRGLEWLALPPGRWRLTITAGPGDLDFIALPSSDLRLDAGGRWILTLGEQEEQSIRHLLAARRRALEEARAAGATPTPETP